MSALRVDRFGRARPPLVTIAFGMLFAVMVSCMFAYTPTASADVDPVITTLSPSHGPVGTQVTVMGTGFGVLGPDGISQGKVHFGNVPAIVHSWTDTAVVCSVPLGFASGAVQVKLLIEDWPDVWVTSNSAPFTVDFGLTSLISPTHPDTSAWYGDRTATLRWEGPAAIDLAGEMSWPELLLASDIEVAGDLAYLATSDAGLRILDVSDPSHPTEAGFIVLEDAKGVVEINDVAVLGDYAYLAVDAFNDYYDPGYLVIVDVSDPAAPVYVSDLTWNVASCHVDGVEVGPSHAYALVSGVREGESTMSHWLRVIDVNDPAAPADVGGCWVTDDGFDLVSGVGELCLEGDKLYLGVNGLYVIDVQDPTSPSLVGTTSNPEAGSVCAGVAAGQGCVYAGSGGSGLDVYDVSQAAAPHFEKSVLCVHPYGTVERVMQIALTDTGLQRPLAFAAFKYPEVAVEVLDLSNALDPRPLGSIVPPDVGSPVSLVAQNEWLYGVCVPTFNSQPELTTWHLGPWAYSYTLDQNSGGVPDTVPEGAGGGLAGSANVTAPTDGIYYFHIRARDHAGNWGPTSTRKVQVDATPPVASDNADDGWHRGSVTVNLSATDAASGFSRWFVSFSGGYTGYLYSPTVTKTYSTWKRGGGSGVYTFTCRAYDNAGNASTLVTRTVKIDNMAPVTRDDAPRDATGQPIPQASPVTVHLTAIDQSGLSGAASTQWRLDGGTWQPGTSVLVSSSGPHWIGYYSTDNAGNAEQVKWRQVLVAGQSSASHARRLPLRR